MADMAAGRPAAGRSSLRGQYAPAGAPNTGCGSPADWFRSGLVSGRGRQAPRDAAAGGSRPVTFRTQPRNAGGDMRFLTHRRPGPALVTLAAAAVAAAAA